ncbi:hypothetical protein DFH07DRAFT_774198 [Mycena maculata]|uniref:Uncharacterized protein n=1 Tax=Mycena maculata TaxID=230809 RepID=A0AAD7IY90_9AGAR|nr:hypothetical protein DFH07DRAFT_774198 [Mycena maculata]
MSSPDALAEAYGRDFDNVWILIPIAMLRPSSVPGIRSRVRVEEAQATKLFHLPSIFFPVQQRRDALPTISKRTAGGLAGAWEAQFACDVAVFTFTIVRSYLSRRVVFCVGTTIDSSVQELNDFEEDYSSGESSQYLDVLSDLAGFTSRLGNINGDCGTLDGDLSIGRWGSLNTGPVL